MKQEKNQRKPNGKIKHKKENHLKERRGDGINSKAEYTRRINCKTK